MAMIQLPYDESITEDRLRESLSTRLPQYAVEDVTNAVGGGFLVKKSGASGAVVKLKHKPDKGETKILVSGFVPSLATRIVLILFLGYLPFLVMTLVANSTVAQEVKEALESDPALLGAGGEAAPGGG